MLVISEANETDTISTLEEKLDHVYAIVSDLAQKVTSLETNADLQDERSLASEATCAMLCREQG